MDSGGTHSRTHAATGRTASGRSPQGSLRTDEHARVLREDGSVIPGLYAAGNASASVMGHSYAGPGATIGPAMTFGYIAALDLVGALNSRQDAF